jgi:hypothetical protein
MSGSNIQIPKFASFKPKPAPPSEPEESPKPRPSDRGHVRHHRHRPQAGRVLHEATRPTNDESLWVIDRKGDVNNLVYGSVHRYNIPPFHRVGEGGVVGAPSNMKINRNASDEKGIILVNRRDLNLVAREKYVFSKFERERPRLLKIRPELLTEASSHQELDFVPLAPKGRRRKGSDSESFDSDDGAAYRSIHGESRIIDQPADDMFQYATESESSGSERSTIAYSSLGKKAIQLSRMVERSPHDIDAWLTLIEHQGSLLLNDNRRRATNAEIRSTADIKIHMYEKALGNARSLEDRERLLLGLMAEGSKVWEIKEQANRWERISRDHIDSLILWKSYVDFQQATFSIFRQEEVRDIFLNRIRLLLKAISTSTPDALDLLYAQLIYVLLRFTRFTRESGYSELAIAIWQAVLEFNFFAPLSSASYETKVSSFKIFWESEVPRIGEDGAFGWCDFVENAHTTQPAAILVDKIHDSLDDKDLFRSWAKAERLRSKTSLIPGRTMDEVVEDDPFRVILFSDIEELLVPLPVHSEHVRRSLLNAYLLFCRQPAIGTSDKEKSRLSTDAFTAGDLLDTDPAWILREHLPKSTDLDNREVDLPYILKLTSSNLPSAPESMFGTMWFHCPVAWRDIYPDDTGPVRYKWFRNTLKQLIRVVTAEDLAVYYLAFEWTNEPETIKKISKSLLKQHPSSLRLYNSYAMVEWWRGNRDVARGVYSAALNMSKSMSEDECRDSIILWKNWIWVSLDDLDNKTALGRLLSIVDCNTSSISSLAPAALLRTRHQLSSKRDFLLSLGDLDHAILYAECLVLVEYLSTNSVIGAMPGSRGDIMTAMSAASAFSQALVDRRMGTSVCHELFLQSTARLLYHHTRIGPFRPAFVREQLTRFLGIFPRNPIFLSLYALNESRLRIENRVRTILISKILVPEHDNLTSRLFAIRYEVNHGTIYSIRSAFENALSSPSAQSSAGLWKFYILFCLQTPQFRSRVKEIWHRALKACPWAKEIYMLGFEKLHGLAEFKEFKETWKVMGEKELRVHVDLEEVFDEIHELEGH